MSRGASQKMPRRSRYEKRTEQIFCVRSEKWSENRSSCFEPKILLISFSGPPLSLWFMLTRLPAGSKPRKSEGEPKKKHFASPHWAERVRRAPPGGLWVGVLFCLIVGLGFENPSNYWTHPITGLSTRLATFGLVPGYTTLSERVRANI